MKNIKKFNPPTFEEIQPDEWLYDLRQNLMVHVAQNDGSKIINCWMVPDIVDLKHYRRLGRQVRRNGKEIFNGRAHFLKDGYVYALSPKPGYPEFGCLCSAAVARHFEIEI